MNSRKLLSENPQAPLKKSTGLFLLSLSSLNIEKLQVLPFLPTLKNFLKVN